MSDSLKVIGIAIAAAAGIGFLIFLLVLSIKAQGEWVAWCEGQQGHVISDTDTTVGTGLDGAGHVVVTTSSQTDYYCLNENGGIIDIR